MSKFFEKITGKSIAASSEEPIGTDTERESYTFKLRLVTDKDEVSGEGTFNGANFLEVKKTSDKGTSLDSVKMPITRDLAEYLHEGSRLERMEFYFRNRYSEDTCQYIESLEGPYSLLVFEFITGVKFSDNFLTSHSDKVHLKEKIVDIFAGSPVKIELGKTKSTITLSIEQKSRGIGFNTYRSNIGSSFMACLPDPVSSSAKAMSEDLRNTIGKRMSYRVRDSFYASMLLAYLMYLNFLEVEKKKVDEDIKKRLNDPAYKAVLTELQEVKEEADRLYRENLEASRAAKNFALMKIEEIFKEHEPDYFNTEEGEMQNRIKESLLKDLEKLRESLLSSFVEQTKGNGEEKVY